MVTQQGCTYLDSVRVLPSGACCEVNLPAAFSPNADGVNDTFAVITGCSDIIQDTELLVYDRWGAVVFRTQDLARGWDGRVRGEPGLMGEYTWRLHYALPNAGH